MRNAISWIISKIKKNDYRVDENISTSDLILILIKRSFMLVRGQFHRIFFKESKWSIFIGKKVDIFSHKNIKLGRGITIEDNCFINALSIKGINIGNNFSLGRNSIIECTGIISDLGEELVIGDNVGIASNAFISVRGKVEISDNTIIGPGVKIFSENHLFDKMDFSIKDQGVIRKGTYIGKGTWIGANAIILDGVKIGNNVVVGAGSIINKNIPDFSVVVGVPGKIIKTINK